MGKALKICIHSLMVLVCSALSVLVVSVVIPSTGAQAATYALLVGVGDYPQLPAKLRLKGPGNDVSAVRGALIQKGVPSTHIHTLLDREATFSNIQTAIFRLTREAQREDIVIFYFSGHGSQTPVQVLGGRNNEEPDQLDEILLPADIGAWDGRRGKVHNALSDDDLNTWITRLRKLGVFVWAIFDTCHAAGATRSLDQSGSEDDRSESKVRAVPPQILGVPMSHLTSHVRGALSRDVRLGTTDPGPGAGGLVAYYASDSDGKARERVFPDGVGLPHHYGVFTHALVSALRASPSLPSYQALMQQVAAISSEDSGQPSPLVEGTAYLAQPVLSPVPLPPPPITIVPDLRLASDPRSGAKAQFYLASLLHDDFLSDGFRLRSVPSEKADASIRACSDGQLYLSVANGDICSNPDTQALRLPKSRRMDKALREDLCRVAVGTHLLGLSATQTKRKNAANASFQVGFELRRKDKQVWSELSLSENNPEPLYAGDVVRPRIRIPANYSLEYSLFFIDAKGRAWLFADSSASPPLQPDLAAQELVLGGLRIDTSEGNTLGLERAVLILSGRHANSPKGSWSIMPSCQQDSPAMIYPTGPSAVAIGVWETTPGRAR